MGFVQRDKPQPIYYLWGREYRPHKSLDAPLLILERPHLAHHFLLLVRKI